MKYVSIAVLVLALACAQETPPPPAAAADHRATDEATIRGLDSAWVKAAEAKNADLVASYYADGASLMRPGAPMATGKAVIQLAFTNFFARPGAAVTFAPDKIDVSGDRALEIGSYAVTLNDKAGKPQTSKGKYVVVWGKQADGNWKALVDAPTTSQ
jgi:uncharacterized protein (TIGR02246 family)